MKHWAIYNLCNKKQYFTCGSVSQYDRMFEMIDNDALHLLYGFAAKTLI